MRSVHFVLWAVCLAARAEAQTRVFDGEQTNLGAGSDLLQLASAGAKGFWLGDVDANGTIDLLTLGAVILGDGHGGLGTPLPFPATNFGLILSADVADVNGDGRTDLIYAQDGLPPSHVGQLVVRISDGLGGFVSTTTYTLLANGYPAAIGHGDLNLDGQPELFVAYAFANAVAVFMNTGSGSFAAPVQMPLTNVPRQFSVGDVSGDSLPDLVTYTSGLVRIFAGNGTGALATPTSMVVPAGTGPYTGSLRLADVDEDGKLDLVGSYVEGTIDVRLGDGLGNFGAPHLTALAAAAQDVKLGDFDLDGHLDALGSNPAGGVVVSARGDGTGGFGASTVHHVGGIAFFPALADMDSDGDIECVAATGPNFVTLVKGNGVGGFDFASQATQGPVGGAIDIAMSDFDSDGIRDAAIVTPTDVRWLRGDGTGGFGASTIVYTGPAVTHVRAGDLDADGKPDLVVVQGPWMRSFRNLGAGAFTPTSTLTFSGTTTGLAVTDVDLDGRADAVAVTSSPTSLLFARGTPSGGLVNVGSFITSTSLTIGPAFGDIDSDGWLDVLIPSNSVMTVIRGLGAAGFAFPTFFPLGPGPVSKAWLMDVNADSKLDLVGTYDSTVTLRLGNGAGGFGTATLLDAGATLSDVVFGDLTGDGIGDLCCGTTSPSVVVLAGSLGGSYGTPRRFGAGANPARLALADVDIDGRLDVVTANNGSVNNNNLNPLGSLTVLKSHAGEPDAPRPFCFGSGAGTLCPCGNVGGTARGCANTVNALGARLVGSGAARISVDSFVLTCSDYPSGPGLYFRGSMSLAAGTPFGAGLLCAGGSFVRLGVAPMAAAGQGGQASTFPGPPPNDVPVSAAAAALPGSVHAYQFLYREPLPGLCAGGTFNVSNAVEATWVP